MPKLVQIPANLADLLKDPQRTRDALTLLNGLATLSLVLVPPTATATASTAVPAIIGDPPTLQLRLPFRFTSGITDPLSNAGSCQTAIIALFTQLKAVGFMPQN